MNKLTSTLLLSIASVWAASAAAQTNPPTPVLHLDSAKVTAKVSPTLYGLMTEEINYSYEGGLYGELVQNRIFRDNDQQPAHWTAIQEGGSVGTIALDETQPIEGTILKRSLKLEASTTSSAGRVGIANDGYWGFPLRPNTTYRASFYAKSKEIGGGPLTVQLESNDGTKVYASSVVSSIGDGWKKYTATLTTGVEVTPTKDARFVISLQKPGTVWFNLVSLFPPTYNNRANGNRPDLMQLMQDMKPTFLRLPGGNFLEGDTVAERFQWKQTLGPLEQRPGHRGCWRYGANDGMGLLEFLEWCEDLKVEPVLALYAGYSLKGEHVEPGPALQPFVEDALEEIEYVTGPVTSKWGALRAKDGHPEPFPLKYVEIGNEDGLDKSGSYESRFVPFFDAIKAKYPKLQCISTVGGHGGAGAERFHITQRNPDVIDEHYYRSAGQMWDDATHYDQYDRNGAKIFVGEWATREGDPTTNMNAALGDAAWMTGMERNSDVVIMSCYAPLFVNVNRGGMQWGSNLIGYNALNSYGSPSYYAQKMFAQYLGDSVISVAGENIPTQTWQPAPRKVKKDQPTPPTPAPKQVPSLFFVATKSTEKGAIYLKLVNAAVTAQPVKIELSGVSQIASEGTVVTLSSGQPLDTNSIQEPTKIVPVTEKISGLGTSFTRTLAPYSISVIQLNSR